MVDSWHLDQSPTDSPHNTKHRATAAKILEQLIPKFKAGFNVSFADYLGREISYEFVVRLVVIFIEMRAKYL